MSHAFAARAYRRARFGRLLVGALIMTTSAWAAISTGIAQQVQGAPAGAVMGGVLLAPVFILTILPVLPHMFTRTCASPRTVGQDGPSACQARLQ